ncbi:MAG: hypothetical protein QXP68_01610 [Thermosphaera sp.]
MADLCLTVASSVLGRSYAESIENRLHEGLKNSLTTLKYEGIIDADSVENLDTCSTRIIIIATGGTENAIAKIAEKTRKVILVSHNQYNSLPAAIETASYLRKLGLRYVLKTANSLDEVVNYVETYVKAGRVLKLLRGARFGLIGGVSDWLVYSRVDPNLLKERLGSEIVEIPAGELIQEYEKTLEAGEVENLLSKALRVNVPVSEVRKAGRLYVALNRIISNHGLKALSIKCFDIIKPTGTTACLAVSLLNSQGFPASCEGDVPLLISMAIGTWVTGKPVFMGNPSSIEGQSLIIAHCSSPLIGPFELFTHFESNEGVGIRVEFPVGAPATIFRIDSDLKELRIGVGRIASHEWSRSLCRTQIKVEVKDPTMLVKEPIGNHYALLIGDHSRELEAVGSMLDLKISSF